MPARFKCLCTKNVSVLTGKRDWALYIMRFETSHRVKFVLREGFFCKFMAMKGIYSYGDQTPRIGQRSMVAPGARVIGNVQIGNDCSIFYNAVLRGDINSIVIGDNSNIQDNATVHLAYDRGVVIGKNVTVGHNAVIHACTIEDGCIVGMGAIVMDGAVIGHNSIVGAGALVTSGKQFPPCSLITGSPARVARPLTEAEIAGTNESAAKYVKVKDQILRNLGREIQ